MASMALQLSLAAILLLLSKVSTVEAVAAWAVTDWGDAHATFYGGQDASGTMGGACGYGNLYSVGYGVSTAALSYAMFNKGLTCGACYELVCKLEGSKYCYPGKSITITATNSCPPGSEGGWCDPPKLHFDLSYPMFQKLAQPVGGVIPIKYKRVACAKSGGVRFTIHGNPYFNYILVHNVAGAGDVSALAIKGEKTGWYYMSQNWGQFWSASANVVGQALSFKITLGNGVSTEFSNVAPKDWKFGQTFEADNNFK
ncbi:expansin [Marchantia polymorpha subsp. ruderalis]|uniref:Expansin n=2 Tax=Marchantia polymorpha TaxID=3197 RepID=A0A176WIU0_MARPO|nr:hypothetical protein AXG93_3242s1440 [Marchantia polymorpha subsp. ruderalis]PTQ44039.1 hypothetical protein MARPO_0022s0134 [Marchantia polymorpha]PTQ44040.1 hypothetical protein MARPO_0022s0134 [Marchantia polymorpha]BBN04364.1 hypothetical protein Mp_3g03970 [Marchantia polymorpha subsp. ruderalis]BBN04365.1 hypothetical protein Mp_3g03970 [Marchantia polymorpha subsp. ruderalis]|eukprot:PTQ44039.1 hypothetical protein MARPO_0022s0134 [Marchantia polymorpha]